MKQLAHGHLDYKWQNWHLNPETQAPGPLMSFIYSHNYARVTSTLSINIFSLKKQNEANVIKMEQSFAPVRGYPGDGLIIPCPFV